MTKPINVVERLREMCIYTGNARRRKDHLEHCDPCRAADEIARLEKLNAALMECYTHLTYVADTEEALESIRKVEALLEEK